MFNSFRTGGSQTYGLELARSLIEDGAQVTVMAKRGPLAEQFRKAGAQVIAMRWREGIAFDHRGLRQQAATTVSLGLLGLGLALSHGHKFDLVVASQPWPMFYASVFFRRTPVAAIYHGMTAVEYPPAYANYTLKHINHHFAVSHETADQILSVDATAKVLVIGNLFNSADYWGDSRPWTKPRPRNAGLLVSVGTLTENKTDAVSTAIEWLREQPRWRLVIVGDGPMRPALEDAVRRLEVSDRVRFEGSRTDTRPYYDLASVVMGVGRVALEAASRGVPVVIASDGRVFGALNPSNRADAELRNFTGRAAGSRKLSVKSLGLAIEDARHISVTDRMLLAASLETVGNPELLTQLLKQHAH
ncbi:glycosyltransferase family 4 protein [Cryobacterium sp. M91]|uniref:glycosyltransferase family 4 protein n=1 Tax=Cryobacterium sp. M91 TaxID=2048294 RepID=UPI000CE55122|nr:glycosyltransferase family 4 protein [Cryobacterium sp. M91]